MGTWTQAPGDCDPPTLARIAELPLERLQAQRAIRTLRLLEEVRWRHEQLRLDREAVCELLHACVKGAADTRQSSQLLALRRDIHNLRDSARARFENLREWIPPPSRIAISDWLTALDVLNLRQAAAFDAHAEECARARDLLAGLAREPAVLNALLVTNPDLHRAALRYEPGRVPQDKRQRLLERNLMRFVARGALRPTPLSTLASVAPLPHVPCNRCGTHARLAVNRVLLLDVARALEARAGVADMLPVRLEPTLELKDDVFRWIRTSRRRRPGQWHMLACEHRVQQTAATAQLRWLVDHLIATPTVLTLRMLAERLAAATKADPESAMSLLRRLRDAGFLVARASASETAPDYLGELCASIPAQALGADPALVSLDGLRAALQEAECAPDSRREGLISGLREQVASLASSAGVGADDVRRQTIFEDVIRLDAVLPSRPFDEPGLERSLQALARMSALFDSANFVRALAREFLLSQVGADRRIGFIDLFMRFAEWRRHCDGARLVAPLLEAQRRVIGLLESTMAIAGGAEPAAAVDLAALEAILDAARPLGARAGAVGIYVQHARCDAIEGLMAVQTLAGQGKGFARFALLIDEARRGCGHVSRMVAQLRRWNDLLAPRGAVFADVMGGSGYNGSARPALTARVIEYPGSNSPGGSAPAIALKDLQLHFDSIEGDVVVSAASDGQRIVPVDLGLLHSYILPPMFQLIVQLGGAVVQPLVFAELERLAGKVRPDPVARLSGLRIGPLILRPRRWLVGARALLQLSDERSEAARFAALQVWRHRLGLPECCFVRAPLRRPGGDDSGSLPQGNANMEPTERRFAEPMFVDFSNPLLLGVFERLVETAADGLVFEEHVALPAAAGAAAAAGRSVEYLFEVPLSPERDPACV
jgi:hypothetical protein